VLGAGGCRHLEIQIESRCAEPFSPKSRARSTTSLPRSRLNALHSRRRALEARKINAKRHLRGELEYDEMLVVKRVQT